jgi:7,8-dihydroneopterin aldolase/epimerase/oxygenase
MTDRIILSGIEAYGYGGVTGEERQIGQRYRIDLELRLDISRAAASDDLNDSVSYADAHDIAVAALREKQFNLIESVTERIATALLAGLAVTGVTVRLSKLLPPIDGVVALAAVEVSREASGVDELVHAYGPGEE